MATNNIQVALELGHTALYRPNPATGLTHEWVVFVRGPKDGSGLSAYVSKIIFHLHSSFEEPRRVLSKPPYEVREAGYASFIMPIDIYLKSKGDDLPVKIRYHYNLEFFQEESRNVVQVEKITFRNPPAEFRRKLLEGGGSGVLETDLDATTPGKRWVQIYEHSSSTDRIAGPLDGPLSFEEFARLFGLRLDKTGNLASGAASTPKIIDLSTAAKSSNTADHKSSRKIQPAPSYGSASSPSKTANSSIKQADKAAPGVESKGLSDHQPTSSSRNESRNTQKQVDSSPRTKTLPATASNSETSMAPAAQNPSSRTSSKDSSSRKVKESEVLSPTAEEILKTMGRAQKIMSPLSPRSPDSQRSRNTNNDASEDDDLAPRQLARRGSTGFHLPEVSGGKALKQDSMNWYKMDTFGSDMISEPEPSDSESASTKTKRSLQDYNGFTKIMDKTLDQVLKPHEIEERANLQALLCRLKDVEEIGRVIDILAPTECFRIDRSAGTFSFNLAALDQASVEKLKQITHYSDYEFAKM